MKDTSKDLALDHELAEALGYFRQSVVAWSDATHADATRRALTFKPVRSSWRPVLAWTAATLVLVASIAGGFGLHLHQQQQAAASIVHRPVQLAPAASAPQPAARPVAVAPTVNVDDDAELLARVDKDVAREVPSALEALSGPETETDVQ